jgi:hypothetical protein
MLLAWRRCSPSVAKVAFALGTLLVVPHTTFYNWSMLSVAFALLLHADVRPRWLVPALIALVAIAAAATQEATPWPLPLDRYRPAGTLGIYWIQPATLAAIFALAIAGRGASERPSHSSIGVPRLFTGRPAAMAGFGLACLTAVAFGYVAAAYASGSGPFHNDRYFGREQVLRALPADFPAPAEAQLREAGAGSRLPYRIEWTTDARTSDVAGIMRTQLDNGLWKVVEPPDDGDPATIDLRSARSGEAPVIAEVNIEPRGSGSRVQLEFSPLPASSVPGYEEWLERIGLVVHDVDPTLIDR